MTDTCNCSPDTSYVHLYPLSPSTCILCRRQNCIRIQVEAYMSPWRQFCRRYRIHVDGAKGYKWIQLVSGLHVSGVRGIIGLRASHNDQTWQAQFPMLRRKHGTLHRYFSVHQPSAEISSGLDSNPTCSSAPTRDFTSENCWGVNLLTYLLTAGKRDNIICASLHNTGAYYRTLCRRL